MGSNEVGGHDSGGDQPVWDETVHDPDCPGEIEIKDFPIQPCYYKNHSTPPLADIFV